MKAIQYSKYGNPEVLNLQEVSRPTPKENEILIRVHTSSVNRTDCGFLRGRPWIIRFFSGFFKPKRKILGSEFAGEVVALGASAKKFKVGDRVFGFDDEIASGHGEYMVFPEDKMVTTIPNGINYQTAGVASEGSHYSLEYIRASGVEKGSKVFVNGGTGAIGSAAIQILKSMGAEVEATSRQDHIELVQSLGASQVYDYENQPFSEIVGEYDLFFDSVGKTSFLETKHLLKPGGVFTASEFGPWFSNILLSLWTKIFGSLNGKKVIFPLPRNSVEDLEYIADLLKTGKYKPLIDREYTLNQIPEAFTYVEKGQKIGNVSINHSL